MHDAEIAKVERARRDLDQHLAVGWLGIGSLDLNQRIDAGTALRQLIGTHISSSDELAQCGLLTSPTRHALFRVVH
jgi:hypothetical protein